MSKLNLSKLNVLIITHSFATGPSQELEKYLKSKVDTLTFIDHPFSHCEDTRSSMTIYKKGNIIKKSSSFMYSSNEFASYIKDFFYSIYYGLKTKREYDICIAFDNLNALAALILKKLGKIKKVVFVTIDYTPVRFKNRLLNGVYHLNDRICCYNSDIIWNDSELMEIERKKNNVNTCRCAKQIVVPSGNNFYDIKRRSINEINRYHLVFMGHILKKQGLDLVIDSLPDILKKVPNARLIIIGKGEYEDKLKKRIEEKQLNKYVKFTGFIDNHAILEDLLSSCAIGIAPYIPEKNSFSFFSDSGKTKVYLATGLPVIITKVSSIANMIDKQEAGFVIEYSSKEFCDTAVKLLTDDISYKKYRKNAITLAEKFDWNNILNTAFKETFTELRV